MTERGASLSKRCARCSGNMLFEPGKKGGVYTCLQCGEEEAEPAPVNGQVPRSDWSHYAIAQLRQLIAEVEAVAVKRTEAERIFKALSVAEVKNVPALPWKAPRAAAAERRTGTGGPRPAKFEKCAECGAPFRHATDYSKRPDGTAVCRFGCPERVT